MAKVPVHERRKLILPLETALDAVLELDSEQGGSLAFGTLVEAQIESEPEPGLSIVVQRRGSGTSERRKFTLPIMAAAFIRYCWKCRIPLPRQGAKSIEVGPDGFVFTIEGTVEVIRRHGGLVPRGSSAQPKSPSAEPSAPPQDSALTSESSSPAEPEVAALRDESNKSAPVPQESPSTEAMSSAPETEATAAA
jgi:hypothetical protein